MKFQLKYNLPFISVTLKYKSKDISISNVLIDTGSASSVFSATYLDKIGIKPEPNDRLKSVSGVGGNEVVYERKVDFIKVDDHKINNFLIQVGAMEYGFKINGIIGMDFLTKSNAIIDIQKKDLKLYSNN